MRQHKCLEKEHGRMRAVIVAALLLLLPATVAAEHEADHRYDVRGYVLDAQKRPQAGVPVTILNGEQIAGSGRTDGEGFYNVRLHLHDSDIGKPLVVRAGNAQAEIRMQAERGDRMTARIHTLNFVGGRAVEEKLSAGIVPTWAYIAAAPVLLWAIVYATGAARRRTRRAKSAGRKKKGKGKK